MIQEILTYLIVAAAVAYSIYHIYRFFLTINKKGMCACSSCPLKKRLDD